MAIGAPLLSKAKMDEAAPLRRFQPIVVEATTLPLLSVARMAEARFEYHMVPESAALVVELFTVVRSPETEDDACETKPPVNVWRLVQELVLPRVGRQVVPIAKHPVVRAIPLPYSVEVAVVKFATLLMERMEPGDEVPIPRLPLESRIPSVRAPAFSVEKRRSPFPPA